MTTPLTFGPPGREWTYSSTTRTYDLSPPSQTKITIPATEGPENTSFTIDPEKSALVIVDMQNFFLDEKCMVHPNGLKAVGPTIKVVEKCRSLGIRVRFLHLNHNLQGRRARGGSKEEEEELTREFKPTGNLAQLGPNRNRPPHPPGRRPLRLHERHHPKHHHLLTTLHRPRLRPRRFKRSVPLRRVLERGYLSSLKSDCSSRGYTLCEEPHEWDVG